MKKDYLKPTLEVVEVQLSDCIAGSVIVGTGDGNHSEMGRTSNWTLDEVETLN